jgi:phospholipase/carboxylesterase
MPVTVLLLHDAAGNEKDLIPIGKALAPGAAIVSPRISYPANPAQIAEWLGQFEAPIYALGYAEGASLAASLMLQHPGVIAGAALLRPLPVSAPPTLPDLKGAPVLISAARDADSELGRLLSSAGAKVDIAIQNADNDLTPADFSLGKQWFAQFLTKPH